MDKQLEASGGGQPRKYHIDRTPLQPNAQSFEADPERATKFDSQQRSKQMGQSIDVLMSWPKWEIWPFKLAVPASGFFAALPGLMLNATYRSTLLLGHFGRTASYMAAMGIPAVTTGVAHVLMVSTDILEQRTMCPVCVQVRSATIQVAGGFIYPSILATVVNYGIASGMKSLYFPKLHKQPKEVFNFTVDVFKSVRSKYLALGALQVVFGMSIAYLQQDCYFNTIVPILKNEQFSKETRKDQSVVFKIL